MRLIIGGVLAGAWAKSVSPIRPQMTGVAHRWLSPYILNENISATCNNFKDFNELQFIEGNQLIRP